MVWPTASPKLAAPVALMKLELVMGVRQIVMIWKSPLRLLAWIGLIIAGPVAGLIVKRVDRPLPSGTTTAAQRAALDVLTHDQVVLTHLGTAVGPGLYLIVLGLWLLWVRPGSLGTLVPPRSADYRFVLGVPLSPRWVMTWLMLRRSGVALIISFVLGTATYVRGSHQYSPSVVISAAALVPVWSRIAAHLAAHRQPKLPISGVAQGLLLVGVAATTTAAVGLVRPGIAVVDSLASFAAHLPPGSWVLNAVQGGATGWFVLILLAGVAALTLWFASDFYPELVATGTRQYTTYERGAGPPNAEFSASIARVGDAHPWPGVVLGMLWLDWMTGWRHPLLSRLWVAGPIVLVAGAAVIGGLARLGWHATEFFMLLVVWPLLPMISTALGSPRQVGPQLRSFFWWTTPASIRTKLFIGILGAAAPWAVVGAVVPVVGLAVAGEPLAGLVIGAAGLASAAAAQAVGLAAHALVPARIDRPLYNLAVGVLMTALVMGTLLVAAVVGGLTNNLLWMVAGFAGATALALLMMFQFAVNRITRRGILHAALEAR